MRLRKWLLLGMGTGLLAAALSALAPPAVAQGSIYWLCQTAAQKPPTGTTCPAGYGSALPTQNGIGVPLGYQQLTGMSTAQGLTVPTGATEAFVVCDTQAVRWRDDGTAPTASVGVGLAVGVGFPYTGALSAIKFIEQTASATCNVSYYR